MYCTAILSLSVSLWHNRVVHDLVPCVVLSAVRLQTFGEGVHKVKVYHHYAYRVEAQPPFRCAAGRALHVHRVQGRRQPTELWAGLVMQDWLAN